jgi:ABC-type nickel/cobalt efflux system permease component RcnA
MFGIDDAIAGLGGEGGILLALVIAALLGLRHATDPDHLTAVTTLLVSDGREPSRRGAGALGLAWGTGHGLTLLVLGLPVVLAGPYLPEALQRAAEVAVGLLIVALAVRLLLRWRRGYFHAHVHAHGDIRHAHPHIHENAHRGHDHPAEHSHSHPEDLGRTARAAFGIGLLHGAGGSAAAGVLLVGAIPDRLDAAIGLVLFAVASAMSMTLASYLFASALARGPVMRRMRAAVPALGVLALLFGAWYAVGALEAVPNHL